ncbi:MAG: AMP-binding protein [Candidatus Omnitrophota bacterium]
MRKVVLEEACVSPPFATLAEIVGGFPERGAREAIRFYNGFRIFRYSYIELYDQAQRCAAFFAERGIGKGDRLLLWAPNGPEWAAVYCACALSGVVLVPLDARNEADFVRRVGEETEAKLLIRAQTKKNPGFPFPSLIIETLFKRIADLSPLKKSAEIAPGDLMEIVYTSGTTGDPKGVMLTQGNMAANATDLLKVVPVDSTYHLLSVLPLSHALEQCGGFWTPLAGGGSVLYLRVLKPSALFDVFRREQITVMILVPRLMTILKQRIESEIKKKHLSSYLRLGLAASRFLPHMTRKWYFYPIHKRFNTRFHLFVCGGAPLDAEVEAFWRGLGFELLQGYGLTETSPVLTATRLGKSRLGSVGTQLDSVAIRLMADREIQARGPNVFPGYYRRPQATKDSFEDGWFKTGDAGEFDAEGNLFIRSRIKDVIVASDGVNIYPEDIERVLDKNPAVKESCVFGAGEHEETIHAVLLLQDEKLEAQQIVEEANRQLTPEQKIASFSVWTQPEFPKTSTLKIKKNEVKKITLSGRITRESCDESAASPLRRILCEIAHCQPDNLIAEAQLGNDLGLSSIDRVELISRLEEEYRLDIDDGAAAADAKLGDLEDYLAKRREGASPLVFRRWTLSPFWRAARVVSNALLVKPFLKIFCDIRVFGLENIQDLQGPVFIVSNHTSHVDTLLIQNLPPPRLGRRICPAAWKEYFDAAGKPWRIRAVKWAAWQLATTLINIFPLPQTSGYRQSMAYAGELLDEGWSLLLFPEGSRSVTGELMEFQQGIGILAKNLQTPLIPAAIAGGENIMLRGRIIPKRGVVKIAFGKPFMPMDGSYQDITLQVKAEIMALWKTLKSAAADENPEQA